MENMTTRRNHTGNFTTTLILDSGRVYGHGRTRIAAEAAARAIHNALIISRREQAAKLAERASR
jgi:hypothetical protein